MKLATTLGDFYPAYCASPLEAVRAFEGTGFRHLDYSFYHDLDPAIVLSDDWMRCIDATAVQAHKLGMDFVQAHAPGINILDENRDDDMDIRIFSRCIEACAHLGIDRIVAHSACIPRYIYPQDREGYFAENRGFFRRLYPAMERYEVQLLIENSAEVNSGGRYFFMTGQEMRDFVDYCAHPLLKACWDTGHANLRNSNQYDDMLAIGDALAAVHIQDNFGECDQHIAPFMGTLDVDAVMHALMDVGYTGSFTFEADNMISKPNAWPIPRNAMYEGRGARAPGPTLHLKRKAVELLYEIGKSILEAYNCFEG